MCKQCDAVFDTGNQTLDELLELRRSIPGRFHVPMTPAQCTVEVACDILDEIPQKHRIDPMIHEAVGALAVAVERLVALQESGMTM